jgi:uncharacterized protein YndB with AHSA1/START domain
MERRPATTDGTDSTDEAARASGLSVQFEVKKILSILLILSKDRRRMIEVIRERIVAAPPERVWAVVEPVARLPEWFAGFQSAAWISGAGVGRRQRVGGQWGRKHFEIEQTVIIHDPPRRLAWKHDRELLNGRPAPKISVRVEFHIELEPAGAGTRVRLNSRQWPDNFLKRFLLRRVAQHRIGGMMDAALGRLEELCGK